MKIRNLFATSAAVAIVFLAGCVQTAANSRGASSTATSPSPTANEKMVVSSDKLNIAGISIGMTAAEAIPLYKKFYGAERLPDKAVFDDGDLKQITTPASATTTTLTRVINLGGRYHAAHYKELPAHPSLQLALAAGRDGKWRVFSVSYVEVGDLGPQQLQRQREAIRAKYGLPSRVFEMGGSELWCSSVGKLSVADRSTGVPLTKPCGDIDVNRPHPTLYYAPSFKSISLHDYGFYERVAAAYAKELTAGVAKNQF